MRCAEKTLQRRRVGFSPPAAPSQHAAGELKPALLGLSQLVAGGLKPTLRTLPKPLTPRTLRTRPQQLGFTLLEVLVALGIAATALVSLYTLAGQLLKSSAALDVRQAALWCADNRLVTVSLSQFAPPLGESPHACSQLGREYTVKQTIIATPNPLFRRIELGVFAKEDRSASERLAFLATVIPQDAGR